MKRILTAVLALTTLAAPMAAMADDRGDGHGRGRGNGHGKHERRDRDYDNRDDRRDERRAYREGYRDARRSDGYDRRSHVYVQPRGYYAPRPRIWSRGQVLPYDYRRAVVYDPYRYGLPAPPRGHAWVSVGQDVYLTQLGSGLIVEVLRDSYY